MPTTTKTKKKPKTIKTEKPDTVLDAQEAPVSNGKDEKYYETVGRRKSSVARVRIYTKKASDETGPDNSALITVNGKDYQEYFHNSEELKNTVEAPLKKLKSIDRFKATVKVLGGGITGQAEAIRHGLSRALVLFDPNFSKKLKKSGYLTRNPKEKERRKYGLKKARKAPQWAKR